MKRLVASHSQHFLRGPDFIAELVGHSNIRPRDLVLDIGAGSGAITAVLARRAGRVVAYESEPTALAALRDNMRTRQNVEVVAGDFMSASLPDEPYKVFANIPFSLSSPIVRKLCLGAVPPKSIYLIVQKQFAHKLVTSGNHFHAALGMMIGPWWVARVRRPLRRIDFTPPPAVDTVLLELKPRDLPLLPATSCQNYTNFVEQCYAEPHHYAKFPSPPGKKPSELTLEQWVALYSSTTL